MSLRLRIAAAAGLAVALVAIALGAVGWAATRAALRGEVDKALTAGARPLARDDGRGDGGGPSPDPPRFGGAPGAAQRVLPDGTVQRVGDDTASLPVDAGTRAIAAAGTGSRFRDATVDGVHLRIYEVGAGSAGAVAIARPLTEVDATLDRLLVILAIASGAGVLLAAGLGAAVARTALRPVRRFTARTEAIAAAPDVRERLDPHGSDELARLARSFNRTLDALERSVEAQRNLVADASHELRTPIASLRANVQVLEDADRLPPDDLAALRADIVDELDELTALVADIVELARGGARPELVDDVRLDELVASLVERFRRRFPDRAFSADLAETLVVGDAERIARAVSNLLDNARKWTPAGGGVHVALADGWLEVRDEGPGFAEADLPHVFDRFYRAAGARGTSGSGLGLAIVRQAAESHGGAVEASNAPGGGARVRIRFASLRSASTAHTVAFGARGLMGGARPPRPEGAVVRALALSPPAPAVAVAPCDVEIVIPVFNEEGDLARSVQRLHAHLEDAFPWTWQITVADNASTDDTWEIASALAVELPGVRAVHLPAKGRGRALAATWAASDARVVAYMDVDLSTDLAALVPLIAPLLSGHSDLAIGTRLARQSRVVRGPRREVISRAYNLILRAALRTRFSDAQCGFKAIRADRARTLLPLVEDTGWFFDTELLVLAERSGMRIHEVPVDWVDDPDSRVDVVATALADLRGIGRLIRSLAGGRLPLGEVRRALGRDPVVARSLPHQAVVFGAIGVASTALHLALFVLLRGALGAQAANAAALVTATLANTAANRRLTFGLGASRHGWRSQGEGLALLGVGLGLTSGALALLDVAAPGASRATEVAVLVAANALATLVRFVLFRAWVFNPRRHV